MTKDVQQQKIYSGTRLLRTLEGNEKEYVLNKVRSIQKCDFPRRHHGQSRNICVYTQGVTRFIQLLGAFLALFRLLVLFVEKSLISDCLVTVCAHKRSSWRSIADS